MGVYISTTVVTDTLVASGITDADCLKTDNFINNLAERLGVTTPLTMPLHWQVNELVIAYTCWKVAERLTTGDDGWARARDYYKRKVDEIDIREEMVNDTSESGNLNTEILVQRA